MNDPFVQSIVHKARHLLGPDFADEIGPFAERYSDKLHRLKKAAAQEDAKRVRGIQRTIFMSYGARVVCLVRSLDKDDLATAEWVRLTAQHLNPFRDPDEPVVAWAEPKGSGKGWRPICSFGPKRKALQTMCADILLAKFEIDSFNYLATDKGLELASDRIVELLEKEKYECFVLADIKDFYKSVQQKCVPGVTGLPVKVVENCLLVCTGVPLRIVGNTNKICTTLSVFDGAVRQGLPQGSRASHIVAALLLGPALREVTSAERIVVYGDDIAIAASYGKEATSLLKALIGVLASHPAGPFHLKHSIRHRDEGIDFGKYRQKWNYFKNGVRRWPAAKCYHRYARNVKKIAASIPYTITGLKKIIGYRNRWMKSFLRWRWNWNSKSFLWYWDFRAIKPKKMKAVKK